MTSDSTTELIERLRAIERQLGELEALHADRPAATSRNLKLILGSVATFGGVILAPPTGGLTAFIAGLGVVLWADGIREDAQIDSRRRLVRAERDLLRVELETIGLELQERLQKN